MTRPKASPRVKLPVPTEHQAQKLVVAWLRWHRVCFCAVPNAGKRGYKTAARLKAEGLVAGVPDLLIFDVPPGNPGVRGVALEMKRDAKSRATPEQLEWRTRLRKLGWIAEVVHGAEDAIQVLKNCGFGRRVA